jgi:hypothetical protein
VEASIVIDRGSSRSAGSRFSAHYYGDTMGRSPCARHVPHLKTLSFLPCFRFAGLIYVGVISDRYGGISVHFWPAAMNSVNHLSI